MADFLIGPNGLHVKVPVAQEARLGLVIVPIRIQRTGEAIVLDL